MNYDLPVKKADFQKNKPDISLLLSESMQKVLAYQAEHSGEAFQTDCGWDKMRENYIQERKFWNEGGSTAHHVKELTITGPVGEIPVRIYYPSSAEVHHGIIFSHGGGFIVGNNDTHDRMMRSVMNATKSAVIGVDYSLAPEVKFPIPVYEVATVAEFFHENGLNYGILPDKIGLCGDSGGANLALATNLFLRDGEGGNDFISGLLLFYGLFGLEDSCSARNYGNELDGMGREDLEYYVNCYLSSKEERNNPYFDCFANDLSYGIPSTYLCCGSFDPLLDDSILLEDILKQNKVKTQLDIVPNVLHAFLHYGKMMEEANFVFGQCGAFYEKYCK